MTEMFDKVETAIFEACEYALPPHLLARATRAAIEAMREPTAEMLKASWRRNDDNDSEEATLANWQGMVDAALGKVAA